MASPRSAYAGTATAGQVLTAANVNLGPGGEIAYSVLTANSTAASAETDATSVTFTAVANRKYRLSFSGMCASTVAADVVSVFITDGSNTHLSQISAYCSLNTTGYNASQFVDVTPSAGSVTYKIRTARFAGTGNAFIFASATQQASFVVDDIGPSF